MTMINARSGGNCVSGNHKPFSLIVPALLLIALLAMTASSFAADAPQKGECSATDSFTGELLNPGVNLGNIQHLECSRMRLTVPAGLRCEIGVLEESASAGLLPQFKLRTSTGL